MINEFSMDSFEVIREKTLAKVQLPDNILMGGNHHTEMLKHYQTQQEIDEFLKVVAKMTRRQVALEIGLYNGGTHLLWKMYFEHVVSVEVDLERCLAVMGVIPDRESSWIIVGDSTNSDTVDKTIEVTGNGIDLLFIDACHSHEACQWDWMSYSPLVRSGGIVAFHDSRNEMPGYGVGQFLHRMEKGFVEGFDPAIPIHNIYHGNGQGISYYFKP